MAFAAVLYGMYEYLFSAKPQTPLPKVVPAEEGTSQYIERITLKIKQADLTDLEDYTVKKTQKKWDDIFVSAPLQKPETHAEKETEEINLPVYTGYVRIENRIFVIVNGKGYKEGDILPGTEYKLIRVSPKEIVLRNKKKEYDPIPLADEVEKRYCISLKEITVREDKSISPAADKDKGFYETERKKANH